MKKKIKNIYSKINYKFNFFYIGLFLLPSAFALAAIFLLISLIISSYSYKENFLKDKSNIFFFVASILMIISSLIHTFTNNYLPYDFNHNLSWIGLANWFPFFWCFNSFKPYLNSTEKRRRASLILLTGSFPVLITGLGQTFFNWHGPFEIFNGFIIWYQRPLQLDIDGLTGLFNNPNYAGIWLNVIWPFCVATILDKREYLIQNLSIYFFTFGISFCTVLTNSRSAWLGIFLGSLIMLGRKSFNLIRNSFLILSLIISATIYPIFGLKIQNVFKEFIPERFWLEFSDFQFSRIEIWKSGISSIINYPFFGTGASSFPEIFRLQTGLWKGHAHNLPLELIISYGIPVGVLIFYPILKISYESIKRTFLEFKFNQNIYDKSWVTALIVILTSQFIDVQYFDGRISLIFWILLSGSKNIINEE